MKKPLNKPESKQKMKVIKGIVRGEKSFTINPKDLERERKANKKALEEIAKNRSEKIEKTLNEKSEDAFKDSFKKSLKPASIPKTETTVNIPLELLYDKIKDTTKIIITEAKLKASEGIRKKYNRRDTPVSQSSPQQKDFEEWSLLNRELIASKVKEGKRGYRTQLYELASQRIDFKSSTFYRLLKKFVKNLK